MCYFTKEYTTLVWFIIYTPVIFKICIKLRESQQEIIEACIYFNAIERMIDFHQFYIYRNLSSVKHSEKLQVLDASTVSLP